MSGLKLLLLSAYYFIYLTMEKWVNPILIITAVAAGILGWYTVGKKQAPKLKWGGDCNQNSCVTVFRNFNKYL